MMSPHPNNPLIYSVGVAQISGGSFFLRSRFKRLRSPFQDTPVYMVTSTSNYMVTSTCLSLFKITKHTPLQICDKHHQQEEQYLENKHALQALPGCIDKQTSILKLIVILAENGFFTQRVSGHGEEYFYEDDGSQSSLCLALAPPDASVRHFFFIPVLNKLFHVSGRDFNSF